MSRGAFNRNARRSGGDRIARIVVGQPTKALPSLSFPCFENRHTDCFGVNVLMGEPCECGCHRKCSEGDNGEAS